MKKEEGFPGQISFVIPDRILGLVKSNPLTEDLYLTDIGYYPEARHHFRERPTGSSQFILIYCVGGRGVIRLNETAHELVADHFFIVPAGRRHSYHSDEQDPWSIYWIHFSGSKSILFNRYAGEIMAIERVSGSRISDRIDLFSEIFRNLDRGFSLETLEYVNLCLPHLLTSFTHLSQFRLVREPGENDPVGLGINFMLEHLTGRLKLQEIAERSGLSASHFSRLFLNSTGHSPIEYFIQLKVQRACRLLDHPAAMVADVSRELGFEDQFYFSRVFSRVMGISPTVYRKRGVYNDKM